MNKERIIRKRWIALSGPVILGAIAALFVLPQVMVKSSIAKEEEEVKPCMNWLGTGEQLKKNQIKVEDAFNQILSESVTNMRLRKQLLDRTDCYNAGKAAVEAKLKELYPDDNIVFPKEALVIFYEDDDPDVTAHKTRSKDFPTNHCLFILNLPEANSTDTNSTLQNNLRCCYPVWGPNPPDSKK